MKKKVLSIVLAICLCIPCVFSLSACGEDDRERLSLAGKTVVFDYVDDIKWDEAIAIHAYQVYQDKEYVLELTTEQFVEEFYNTRVISSLTGVQNIDSVEKAKTALRNKALTYADKHFSNYKFSADGKTAVRYACSDTDFSNPLETYAVTCMNTEFGYSYMFNFTEGHVDGYLLSEPDYIRYFGTFEGIYLDITDFTDVMATLRASDGSTLKKPLAECSENLTITLSSKNYYKIV